MRPRQPVDLVIRLLAEHFLENGLEPFPRLVCALRWSQFEVFSSEYFVDYRNKDLQICFGVVIEVQVIEHARNRFLNQSVRHIMRR